MSSTIFERLAATELEHAAAYAELVDRLARGTEADPEAVSELLRLAGRTAAELQADVDRLASRLADHELLGTAAELAAAQAEARERIDAAGKALRAAQTAHDAVVRPLRDRLAELHERATEVRAARKRLAATAPAERLRARDAAAEALAAARREAREARSEAAALRQRAGQLRADAGRTIAIGPRDGKADAEAASQLDRLAAEADRRAAAAEGRIAELEVSLAASEAALLTP
jgi:hypothetical protein